MKGWFIMLLYVCLRPLLTYLATSNYNNLVSLVIFLVPGYWTPVLLSPDNVSGTTALFSCHLYFLLIIAIKNLEQISRIYLL